MQILYVHGAGSSDLSFHWLREQLPGEAKFFTYPLDHPLSWSIRRLEKRIAIGQPLILLGHSLGGVMARACADHPNVTRLITLNSPFGGIQYAALLSLFAGQSLIRDLDHNSPLLTAIREKAIHKPHLALVGTSGSPLIWESNDGVVSVRSQTAIPNLDYKLLPINHFEMLLSTDVVHLIRDFIS